MRIFLVDDHASYRKRLGALLDDEPGLEVVGEAPDGETAIQRVPENEPDVVLMDVEMPGLGGVEATRQIMAALPDLRVIALSLHRDKRFVEAMFDAGASGYVLKDSEFSELLDALRVVTTSNTYLDSALR